MFWFVAKSIFTLIGVSSSGICSTGITITAAARK
jgi:hypothetical protein